MEEQYLTQKQFKTIKTTYGLLKGIFILFIVLLIGGTAVAAIGFTVSFVFKMANVPVDAKYFVSFVLFIVTVIVFYLMVHNKHANRKRIVSVTLFIYAVLFSGIRIFNNFILDRPENLLLPYIICYILSIITAVIFIYLAFLLLQKTRDKKVKPFAIKPLFIIYIVSMYMSLLFTIVTVIPSAAPGYLAIVITVSIILGLLLILIFLPLYVLYKSLSDDVFYQDFLVSYPLIAINRYQAIQVNKTKQENNGYCIKCCAPLRPGAAFCTVCGNKKDF